jgi:hypothetical protein
MQDMYTLYTSRMGVRDMRFDIIISITRQFTRQIEFKSNAYRIRNRAYIRDIFDKCKIRYENNTVHKHSN